MNIDDLEIIGYNELNTGCLVAKFSIGISSLNLLISSCCLFEKNGSRWISFPSQEVTNNFGKKNYYSYIKFDNQENKDAFSNAILTKLKTYAQAPAIQKPSPSVPGEPSDDSEGALPF